MRDLPSRGRCHATFLLAYSARVRRCADVVGWVRAALEKPTHMAASLDLGRTAELLIDVGLARIDEAVRIGAELARLDQIADISTLKAIARLLLVRRPPDWLHGAVVDEKLVVEFVPAHDMETLSWLGPDLEPIIVAAHRQLYAMRDDAFLKLIGDAGELIVMAALQAANYEPRHVSRVSDRFGYDIEYDLQQVRYGLEIKTVVSTTADRILLSRHEFDVAGRMGGRWKVVQVTISSSAFVQGAVRASDIAGIRELPGATLAKLAPADTLEFRWSDSAEFRPHPNMWVPSSLPVPADFSFQLST